MNMKDIALTVNNKMALYTLDFLEAVNAFGRIRQSAATACTVYETDSRIFIAFTLSAGFFKKEQMNSVEYTLGKPISPFVIYGFPMRITWGQKSPLATAAQKVENRFKYTDWIMLPFAFHQFGERIDQQRTFLAVDSWDVNVGIIIILFQSAE